MALGDGKLIAERFEKRAVTLSIWSQVEQALDRAQRAGGSPEQILKAADDLMESVSDPVLRNHGTLRQRGG